VNGAGRFDPRADPDSISYFALEGTDDLLETIEKSKGPAQSEAGSFSACGDPRPCITAAQLRTKRPDDLLVRSFPAVSCVRVFMKGHHDAENFQLRIGAGPLLFRSSRANRRSFGAQSTRIESGSARGSKRPARFTVIKPSVAACQSQLLCRAFLERFDPIFSNETARQNRLPIRFEFRQADSCGTMSRFSTDVL